MSRSGAITFVLAAAVATLAAGAAGAAPPPDRPLDATSAVAQYIEEMPTASGPRASGPRTGTSAPSAGELQASVLSAEARTELSREGGPIAERLEEVATSPSYGAPTERLGGPLPEEPDEATALGAAAEALTPGEPRIGLLLALLLGITAAALGAAGYRASRSSS